MITGYKSMVGSVDALHCGTDDKVEELGGPRADAGAPHQSFNDGQETST